MSRPVKRGVGKKIPKAATRAPRPVTPTRVAILEQGEDLDNLFSVFGVTDENDIQSVVNGSVGEDW